MAHLGGQFTVTGGSEQPIGDEPASGPAGGQAGPAFRLTRVSGTQRFEGDVVGEGSVEWVFAYAPDRSADFAGFQRISGSIGGRSGSFMLESTGHHDGTRSAGRWRIVGGSGTDDLAGIRGRGSFRAPGGATVDYELDVYFD